MLTGTYADLAERIVERPARLGRTRLVAVDGPSGAGKSVFADRLAAALEPLTGEPVPIVHTDDLLDGWADQLSFWPRLERLVLRPLAAGRPGRYWPYDWNAAAFASRTVEVPPAPVVLLEGVSSARAAVRPRLSLAVFVTAPTGLRLERAVARDGEAIRPYLEAWRRGEEGHFAADATAVHADLVVDGSARAGPDPAAAFVRLR